MLSLFTQESRSLISGKTGLIHKAVVRYPTTLQISEASHAITPFFNM